MQTASAEKFDLSPEDYLQGEKHSHIRHEYIDGEVFAMAGGSDAHARISGNAFALLKNYLRGSGCSVYLGEMKIQTDASKFFYPDVMVTCDKDDLKRNYAKQNPTLLIEVLSPSTEGYDRGKKFEYYRQIETLEEYVLIDQSEYKIDIFRKNPQHRWELFTFHGAQIKVDLSSLNCSLNMLDLYEDVDFELIDIHQENLDGR